MLSLLQIEQDLTQAMKARDQVAVDTLRGLKTRIQNAKVAKTPAVENLPEEEIVALIKSEIKRRKEAAESFSKGDRQEAAEKELKEAAILEKYLPAQMPEEELTKIIEQTIKDMSAGAADFGKVMGALKGKVGNKADGAVIARILKEKLK